MDDWIEILSEPIVAARAIEFATDLRGGAVAVFLGTTRAQINAAGRELIALDYEVYADMALAQFQELARRVRSQWPILRLALLHRAGRVPLGDCSIVVAVRAAHREDAFAACRFLIDSVKDRAAIWKKEIWSDGSETWGNSPPRAPRDEDT